MAISIIGTPQVAVANNGAAATITWSTTPSAGDYTVVINGSPADGAAIGTMTTTGYSLVTGASHTGAAAANPSLAIFYKKQTATPDTTAVGTSGNGAGTDTTLIGFVLRGVDPTTFSDATPTTAGETTSTNPDPASITVGTTGATVIVAACMTVIMDAAITAPSGYTGYSGTGNDTYDHTLAAAYKLNCSGTEAPASWTNWGSGLWYAITIAVKPYVITSYDVNVFDTVNVSESRVGAYSSGSVGYIQSKKNSQSGGSQSDVTLDNTPTAGNLIVVGVTKSTTTELATNLVSDNRGNTYTRIFERLATADRFALYYAYNISTGSPFTVSASLGDLTISVHEFGNALTSDPLDQTANNGGTGTAVDSGNVVVADNGELYFGLGWSAGNGVSWTAGTGYVLRETELDSSTYERHASEDKYGAAQTTSGSFTIGTSNLWMAGIATFKPNVVAATRSISGAFDTVNISENVTVIEAQYKVNVFDDVNVTQNITAGTTPKEINVFDSVEVSENLNIIEANLIVSVFDSIETADNIILYEANLIVSLSESVEVSEYINLYLLGYINVFDSVNVSENLVAGTTPKFVDVYDSIEISENITSKVPLVFVNVFDSVGISEDITISETTGITEHNVDVFDELTTTENITAFETNLVPSVFSEATASENITIGTTPKQINVFDSISVAEDTTASETLSQQINVFDSVGAGEKLYVQESADVFRFIVLTDAHYGESDYITRFPAKITDINTNYPPQLVITGGDNIHDAWTGEDLDNAAVDWKDAMEVLVAPFLWCFGNHDETMDTSLDFAGIEYHKPWLYQFTHKGTTYDVVILESDEGTVTEAQLTWLTNNLSENPTFIMMHHPVTDTQDPARNITNATAFRTIVEGTGNVKAVFAGHNHNSLVQSTYNNVDYINNRRAGGSYGVSQGFGVVEITDSNNIFYYTVRDDAQSTSEDFYIESSAGDFEINVNDSVLVQDYARAGNRVAFVQSRKSSGGISSNSVYLITPPAAGALIVVGVTKYTQTELATDLVSDNQGNTYTRILESGSTNDRMALYYAKNVSTGNSFIVSTSLGDNTLSVHEYNGASADPFDQTNNGTSSGTTLSSGNVTTGVNGELYFGIGWSAGNEVSWAAGSGYTLRETQTNSSTYERQATEDKFGDSQTTAATFTIGTGGTWLAGIATFKPQYTLNVYDDNTVAEDVTMQESEVPIGSYNVNKSDSIQVSEAITVFQTEFNINVFDSITVADNISTGQNFLEISTYDAVEVSESVYIPHFVVRSGDTFELNGVRFRFVGVDSYDLMKAEYTTEQLDSFFDYCVIDGIKVVGTFAFGTEGNSTGNFRYISAGALYWREDGFVALDRVIDSAHRHGIRVVLHTADRYNYGPDELNYCNWSNEIYSTAYDNTDYFITDENIKTWYKQFLSQLINRTNTISGIPYKNEEAIFSWTFGDLRYSLGVDDNINTEDSTRVVTMRNWISEMAAYVKSLDTNHLVGIGGQGGYYDYADWDVVHAGSFYGQDYLNNATDANIDYFEAGIYPWEGNPWELKVYGPALGYSTTATAEGLVAQINQYVTDAKAAGKPFLVTEIGITKDNETLTPRVAYPRDTAFAQFFDDYFSRDADGMMLWHYTNLWDDNNYNIKPDGVHTGDNANGNDNDDDTNLRTLIQTWNAAFPDTPYPKPDVSDNIAVSENITISNEPPTETININDSSTVTENITVQRGEYNVNVFDSVRVTQSTTPDTSFTPRLINISEPIQVSEVTSISSPTTGVVDYYPEANGDGGYAIQGALGYSGAGQSFTGNGASLTSVKFYLRKIGVPTGNATISLYAHSGTYGTSSVPTGSALVSASAYDVTALTTSYQLIEFTFTTPYDSVYGTKYVATIQYTGGDFSNYIQARRDSSSPTHAGNASSLTGSNWSADSNRDLIFYVYGLGGSSDLSVNVNDGLRVSESLSATDTPKKINVYDSVRISESTTMAKSVLPLSVFDAIAVSEGKSISVTSLGDKYISVIDNISLTQALSIIQKQYRISISEQIRVSDVITAFTNRLDINVHDSIRVATVISPVSLGGWTSVGEASSIWNVVSEAGTSWSTGSDVSTNWTLIDSDPDN